ncbi:calpain-like cysteine peptidase, putative [Bodo saltans]|uniref:Calpain-like cysteine peptidase, putative n=1 Tax=Bodo saltans TaxID=75058 RepID=A0A0S4JIG9_BODSA|nr:calpain-like cysteine peptidase, putative [Bodo saltans]|eukprot:CUG89964.1 calpain-like cysteine peptidase, putative [Bodo saltans]
MKLAQTYDANCHEHACKTNSQVLSILNAVDNDVNAQTTSSVGVTIDLSQNIIGSKGIVPLLKTFGTVAQSSSQVLNSRVESSPFFLSRLILRGNFLSNSDIDTLCDALEEIQKRGVSRGNKSLEWLDISDNPISQPAGKRLHLFVARVPSVRTLVLDQTLINVGLQARINRVLDVRNKKHIVPHNNPNDKREGTPIVAPPARLRALHVLFTTSLSICVDPASQTHLTTTLHEPLALLMRSSRVHSESESITDPLHLMHTPRSRNSDGVFPSRAVVDVENEIPTGTVGHWLLKQFDSRSTSTASQETQQQQSRGYLTSPFENLHLLFALPKDSFMGVELLMQSAVLHNFFSRAGVAYSEFPMLGGLRATSETMLRDPERSGLNLLLAAAFGDPQPQFSEMPAAIGSPASPSGAPSIMNGSTTGSPFEARGAIKLPQVIMLTSIVADEVPPLPLAPPGAMSSLLSESSLMSSAADGIERNCRSSASLRDDQLQQLMRATPIGPLLGLMDLCDQEEGASAPLLLLRPTLAALATPTPSQSPAPLATPKATVG